MRQDIRLKGSGMQFTLLTGAILISMFFLTGFASFMVNTYVFNPQAKAIVTAQTVTAAANSLSLAEKGEFIIILKDPVGIRTYRDEDNIYTFEIFYEGVFGGILGSNVTEDITIDIESIDPDRNIFDASKGIFNGGSHKTPFLCRVNEISVPNTNTIYISKLPGENFVRISNFRSKATGGVSI
jgi:hypothetical protein